MTLISTTPYSLGYAVSADVLEAGLPFATMKNKVSKPTMPVFFNDYQYHMLITLFPYRQGIT
jgi:hypothetical protein